MTRSKWVALVTGFALTAVLMRLEPASLAADPLRPDATEHLNLLSLSTFVPSLNVGPFRLRPEISGGATYDDNITLSATNKLADWIWTISPRISAVADHTFEGYGTLLRLDYSPTFVFFNQHTENDNIEHHANLAGSWVMNKLSLGLQQRFDQTDAGDIETGGRLRQRQYNTELDTKYKLGEKTSIELNPRLTISETEKQLGYTEWGADAFLNRQIASKTTGSLGGSGGYVDVDNSPHQTYERALLRLQYAATGKIDLEASAGGERRQFSNRSATMTPVFGIAAAYRPFERTTITLEARRRDEISSALTNENYTATGVTLGIRQRVFERMRVNLTGSYDNRKYETAAAGVTASRRDDVFGGRAEVEISLVHHLSMSFFYQYERDDSNDPTRRFTDNQAGVQGTLKL